MAIPAIARVDATSTSAAEEAASQWLGRDDHKRRRSRLVYMVAWLPKTMAMNAKVCRDRRFEPGVWMPSSRTPAQYTNSASPMTAPAAVRLPIFHEFGAGEGRTLSVVNAMPRKSPVIMMRTISSGVRIACPVSPRPNARNSTWTTFLVMEFNV